MQAENQKENRKDNQIEDQKENPKPFRLARPQLRRIQIPNDRKPAANPNTDYMVWDSAYEVRCTRCGRLLTDSESIELGMGPLCRAEVEAEEQAAAEAAQGKLDFNLESDEGNEGDKGKGEAAGCSI